MKKRSPVAVLLLPLITFGIYSIYWQVATKIEMNKQGTKIPTAWLIIIPFVNIWWLWKYCEGVEQFTKEKLSVVLAFLLLILLGIIGAAIVQSYFNKTIDEGQLNADGSAPPAEKPAVPVATPQVPAA